MRAVVGSLTRARTLDVGSGTGFVSRWLPGEVTLLDASAAMLSIAVRRLPKAQAVGARVPPLPFADRSFDRVFAVSLYGHLLPPDRVELIREMSRVADELVILDQLAGDGQFREGPEERDLLDGSRLTVHKCYFTTDRLLQEIGGGKVLMNGPVFAIVRKVNHPPR